MENNVQRPATNNSSRLADVIAGVSIAGLLITEAVAYSSIAGIPPHAGVVALFCGLIVYALLGSSRFAIVSATSSSAAVVAAVIVSMSSNNAELGTSLAMGLIVLTGIFFIMASWAKLGGISDFIAKPVLRGFAFGLALVIIIKQLPKIVGFYPQNSEFLLTTYNLFSHIQQWNNYGIAIALSTLLLLTILSKVPRIPAALVVIAAGIGLSQYIDLTVYGIKLVGPIQLALVWPKVPQLDYAQWLRLAELAIPMVFILYAEAFGAIQTYAIKHGDSIAPNRDLFVLGLANVLSGLLQGLPVAAGFSATTANETAGAQSCLAGAICAVVVLIIVVTLLPEIALTPEPILAAVVIYAVGHALNLHTFSVYFEVRRDRFVSIASAICVLLFGVLDGLFAGIAMSLAMILKRWAASRVSVLGQLSNSHDFITLDLHPDAHQIDGVLIVRPEEPLFFANVARILQHVQKAMAERKYLHTLILSMEESPDLDSTTLEALVDFAKIIESSGQKVFFVRMKAPALEVLQIMVSKKSSKVILSDLSVDTAVKMALDAGEV